MDQWRLLIVHIWQQQQATISILFSDFRKSFLYAWLLSLITINCLTLEQVFFVFVFFFYENQIVKHWSKFFLLFSFLFICYHTVFMHDPLLPLFFVILQGVEMTQLLKPSIPVFKSGLREHATGVLFV